MKKSDFIKWLVKKEREAGPFQSRFVKTHKNSEEYWVYKKPGIDWLEDDINLEEDGKVIYTYDKDLFNPNIKFKEFTYDEFINTNLDDLEWEV